jgi:hypothetical protein
MLDHVDKMYVFVVVVLSWTRVGRKPGYNCLVCRNYSCVLYVLGYCLRTGFKYCRSFICTTEGIPWGFRFRPPRIVPHAQACDEANLVPFGTCTGKKSDNFSADWHHCDYTSGVFGELRGVGSAAEPLRDPPIRRKAQRYNVRLAYGNFRLRVASAMSIPLRARAAVLCARKWYAVCACVCVCVRRGRPE